ncbi:hypothetical protein SeLEV6574_g07795 [Synchytrium endobioticum]|uniref:Reverse transcriptase domain-containing protein n=1 Tax=Synchytrium endobioticum TaxID=286115 RepID=A0A507CA20_9FUNG|nr:hypothetical protein SeLEV6574_g07795 [Synchytrium endobioticum]
MGGKSTKWYFDKVKPVFRRANVIKGLKDEKGKLQTNSEAIQNRAMKYYKELFSNEETDIQIQEEIIECTANNTEKLQIAMTHQERLVAKISEKEINYALKQLKNGKAPGPDGITTELYKKVPTIVTKILLPIFNQILRLQDEWERENITSIIVLIEKKGDLTSLKNYRPISLLNCDYKLFSKILSIRLATILSERIGPDQHAFLPGRQIKDSIMETQLIAECINRSNKEGVIAFLDQEKAYDRVDHLFLYKLLRIWKFPENFIKLITRVNERAKFRVKINGTLTPEGKIQRGLRQGDPLSCYLYLIIMEALRYYLEADQKLKGIEIQGVPKRFIKMFVDDTNVFLKDTSYIKPLTERLLRYKRGSQAKVNLDKSQILCLGKSKPEKDSPIPFMNDGETVRNLGYPMGKNLDIQSFWAQITQNMQSTINGLRWRYDSLQGRVLIAQSLIASKIWFFAQFLPVKVRNTEEWQTMMQNVIWENNGSRVNAKTLAKEKKNGGLNACFIRARINAIQMSWVKRYYENPEAPWALLLKQCFQLCLSKPIIDKEITDPWLQTEISKDQMSGLPQLWARIWKLWRKEFRPRSIIRPISTDTLKAFPVKHTPESHIKGRGHGVINALMRKTQRNTYDILREGKLTKSMTEKFVFPEDPKRTGEINWGESIKLRLRRTIPIKDISCRVMYKHLREMYCEGDIEEVASPRALRNLWKLKVRPKTKQRVWRILTNRIPRKIDPVRNPHDLCACGKGKARAKHLFSECEILREITERLKTHKMTKEIQNMPETNFKYKRKELTPEMTIGMRIYCTLLQTQWLNYCNWVKQGVNMNTKNGLKILNILVKKEAATDKEQDLWSQTIKELEQAIDELN